MLNNYAGFLKKVKKRRILVMSAGSPEGGIQSLYIAATNDSWEILSSACIPYPQKIAALFNRITGTATVQLTPDELGHLDYRLSCFFTEAAKTTLSTLHNTLRKPHMAILNKPCIWKGATNGDLPHATWDYTLGDAQHLSSSLCIPVLTDSIRHNCIAGGLGILPLHIGNIRIASPVSGIVLFLNIGLCSRMTIIDTRTSSIIVDADTGPGTCCINAIIRQQQLLGNEGFDRDGSLAAQGTVDSDCLKTISEDVWFMKPAPKQASLHQFDALLQMPQFTRLSPIDQLTTATALTARTIYDFYRRECKPQETQQTVLLSGGGAHNQTLFNYLKTYFDTIPVKSVEEIGIPTDMRIPLAHGLTVNAFVSGAAIPWDSGDTPKISPLGKWVLP
jgi:anhydro-N-acetylmuramic acid kinase